MVPKTPLTDVDRKRIKEMSETGQNCVPLLNHRIIKGERFENCIIDGLLVSGEGLQDTRFFRCKINMTANKTDFSDSVFKDCELRGEANYANFDRCDFKNSDLTMLKMRYAIMTRINPCGLKFSLFSPNYIGMKWSKKMVELFTKKFCIMQDDDYKVPPYMLR